MNWALHDLGEVDSTQITARAMLDQGAPEGTVVTAVTQRAGAGRFGRAWHSPKGGLYLSIILRPKGSPRLQELTLVASVAVVIGLKGILPARLRIRWPNDVMVGDKKLAGIIAEAGAQGTSQTTAVVGIGVNCNGPVPRLDSVGPATNISNELGKTVEVSSVRREILEAFSNLYPEWTAGDSVLSEWKALVGTIGRDVSVKMKTEENPFSCRAVDITDDGRLVVERDGNMLYVSAEDTERITELS